MIKTDDIRTKRGKMNTNQILNQAIREYEQALGIYAIFAILFTIFWIMAMFDAIKSDFKDESNKTIWILILLLTSVPGAFIYFLVAPGQKLNKKDIHDRVPIISGEANDKWF
jgi:cyanate permease